MRNVSIADRINGGRIDSPPQQIRSANDTWRGIEVFMVSKALTRDGQEPVMAFSTIKTNINIKTYKVESGRSYWARWHYKVMALYEIIIRANGHLLLTVWTIRIK